jgi:hypothetical protein
MHTPSTDPVADEQAERHSWDAGSRLPAAICSAQQLAAQLQQLGAAIAQARSALAVLLLQRRHLGQRLAAQARNTKTPTP